VAAGAAAGLAIDLMLHGVTLGAATATGAALGALWQTGRSFGRRLISRARGHHELRCDDATLRLLLARQVALLRAVMHRGHAAVQPALVEPGPQVRGESRSRGLPPELVAARVNPHWSSLGRGGLSLRGAGDSGRAAAERGLAERIAGSTEPAG
jgi:hypothetical protein